MAQFYKGKDRCQGKHTETMSGKVVPCSKKAKKGSEYCRDHADSK